LIEKSPKDFSKAPKILPLEGDIYGTGVALMHRKNSTNAKFHCT